MHGERGTCQSCPQNGDLPNTPLTNWQHHAIGGRENSEPPRYLSPPAVAGVRDGSNRLCASSRRKRLRKTMSGIHLRHLLAGLVAFAFVMASVSLVLVYFFPAPPSTITLATAFKGSSFDYYGQRYRERLARDHVNLELKETAGAVENLELLQDPQSGVDAAFIAGGISNSKHAPGLLSLGTIYNNPFWTFYHFSQQIEHLPQLKSKRIAVGPVGSATRQTAERIFSLAGVSESTATFLPIAGVAAADAMKDGKSMLFGSSVL
jgi:hypothetical protein